jgi:hypothetical protein
VVAILALHSGQLIAAKKYLTRYALDLKASRTSFVRLKRAAACQVDIPSMNRAGDCVAVHNALRQRPAFVGAPVKNGKDRVV